MIRDWNLKTGAAGFILVLALSGCVDPQGGVSAITAVAVASGKGDIKADARFVEAVTPEQRAIRACMATAIVSEVWTYRLVYVGSNLEERSQAASSMVTMLESIDGLSSGTAGVWFETELFYSLNTMLRSVAPAVRDRIMSGVENALAGSVLGLIKELETTVVQVALAKIMKRDVVTFFESADLSTPEGIDAGFAACRSRIEGNIAKLS